MGRKELTFEEKMSPAMLELGFVNIDGGWYTKKGINEIIVKAMTKVFVGILTDAMIKEITQKSKMEEKNYEEIENYIESIIDTSTPFGLNGRSWTS